MKSKPMLKGVKGRKRIFLFSPTLFWQCSPVEERLTVNQDVEGSIPSVAVCGRLVQWMNRGPLILVDGFDSHIALYNKNLIFLKNFVII